MGIVHLPLLDINRSLVDAVRAMRRYDRSGVVAREARGFWLYDKRSIIDGLGADASLAALPKKGYVYVPTDAEVKRFANTTTGFAGVFEVQDADYALMSEGEVAEVSTRSERFQELLGAAYATGPSYRRCTGPGRHWIPPTGVDANGNCELDHYPLCSIQF
jgi:hypothetical protein